MTKELAVGSIESKEFVVTWDSLKAKKLRMTLGIRRRAKANTGGEPNFHTSIPYVPTKGGPRCCYAGSVALTRFRKFVKTHLKKLIFII